MTAKRKSPRVAIVSCAAFPHLTDDDRLLRDALESNGMRPSAVVWDSDLVDWAAFDACVIRSVWDYHLKYDDFISWARRIGESIPMCNSTDTLIWNSDKTYLRKLGERGIPTIPTLWLERGSEVELAAVLAARGWEDAILKPTIDLGAMNLHRVAGDRQGAQQVLDRLLCSNDVMVQPFLPSLQDQGETSLVYVGGKLSHAVRKQPMHGDFRVQPGWGGKARRAEPSAAELRVAAQVFAALEDSPLYARIDLVRGLEGPCLIELELLDPNLYLRDHPPAAGLLARQIGDLLGS